jgi:hypothetical protein
VLRHDLADRDRKLRPVLHANHWDTIARRMEAIISRARASVSDAADLATEMPA